MRSARFAAVAFIGRSGSRACGSPSRRTARCDARLSIDAAASAGAVARKNRSCPGLLAMTNSRLIIGRGLNSGFSRNLRAPKLAFYIVLALTLLLKHGRGACCCSLLNGMAAALHEAGSIARGTLAAVVGAGLPMGFATATNFMPYDFMVSTFTRCVRWPSRPLHTG